MALRLAAPALGAVTLASWLVGPGGLASFALLAAIVAASARLLMAVGEAAEGRGARWPVATSVTGLTCLVAAGAARVPPLVLGLVACSALELLRFDGSEPVVESVELLEARTSRAA